MEDRVQAEDDCCSSDRDQRCPCLGEDRIQDETAEERCPQPQDQNAATLAVAHFHQTMMEVTFVGSRHALSLGRSSNDRERRVDDRDAEDEERNEQRRQKEIRLARGVGLVVRIGSTPDHTRRHRHQKSEEQRTAVPHEDLRRVEVVREKTDAHAEGDDRHERTDVRLSQYAQIVQSPAVEEERSRSNCDNACRESVEPVDEIDRLSHADQPEHGDDRNPVVGQNEDVEERDAEVEHRRTEPDQHQTCDHGTGDLGRARKFAHIVDETCSEDDGRCDENPERFGVVVEHHRKAIHLPSEQEGHDEAEEHGYSTDIGCRHPMDSTLVGLHDPPHLVGSTSHQRRGEEGDQSGDQADEEIGNRIWHVPRLFGEQDPLDRQQRNPRLRRPRGMPGMRRTDLPHRRALLRSRHRRFVLEEPEQ